MEMNGMNGNGASHNGASQNGNGASHNGASHNGASQNGNGHGPSSPERVTVVIPAKDEERNVAWVLRRLPPGIDEVILVDGNSTDDTIAVARAVRPDLVVATERGPGKGAAMRTGMDMATGDIIVTIDADGSMDPLELDRYIRLAHDADLVKGSRFAAEGGTEDMSFIRWMGNGVLLALVNLLYGARLTDLCYGYCAVRRSALPALALRSDGFEIETEMTVRALRAGLRVAEVPSFELPRRYGSSHLHAFFDGWRVLGTLLAVRVRARHPKKTVEPVEQPVLPVATEPVAAEGGLAGVDLLAGGGTGGL
jgi:glycosyltransferase involved in cell wall biosynthesis